MGGGGGGEDGEFGFQIAPMVDVVFVLLLFFMACAGQNITEGLLQISLPSGAKEGTTKVPIMIDIDANGNIFVNGTPRGGDPNQRDIPVLREYLTGAMATDPEDPIIIRPSNDTKHERVIDVLNMCKQAKVHNLSFG